MAGDRITVTNFSPETAPSVSIPIDVEGLRGWINGERKLGSMCLTLQWRPNKKHH
jgi:hypothetical protein